MPVNLGNGGDEFKGKSVQSSVDVQNLVQLAERSKREARDWEIKYEALRKSRAVLGETQAEKVPILSLAPTVHQIVRACMHPSRPYLSTHSLALGIGKTSQDLYVRQQEEARESRISNGDTKLRIVDLESLLLKERHRSDTLQSMHARPVHVLDGKLLNCIESLEKGLDDLDRCAGESLRGIPRMRNRMMRAEASATKLREEVVRLEQLLADSRKQQEKLADQVRKLEACLERGREQTQGLHTEREALVKAIKALQSNAAEGFYAGRSDQSPTLESIWDTAGEIEKSLRNLDVAIHRFQREGKGETRRCREQNAMLIHYSDRMAADLDAKDRLVCVLEEELRTANERAKMLRVERVSDHNSFLHDKLNMSRLDAESSFMRQCLLETTAQLAQAQKSDGDSGEELSREATEMLDNVDMAVTVLGSVLEKCAQGMKSREEVWEFNIQRLEAEKAALEISVLDSLKKAEDGLKHVRSRGRGAALDSASQRSSPAVQEVTYQARVEMLKAEVQRLEAVVESKQQRIECLKQHLENATTRAREDTAAERERNAWLEDRERQLEAQILREVERHKLTLIDLAELMTAKESLERKLTALALKLPHSAVRDH